MRETMNVIISNVIKIISCIPGNTLEYMIRKSGSSSVIHKAAHCALAYRYFKELKRKCNREGVYFIVAEAPERTKISGLAEEQIRVLEKNMSTTELLNEKEYLDKVYAGNPRGRGFAADRYRGTKLYNNGKYTLPADKTSEFYNVFNGIRYTPAAVTEDEYKKRNIRLFGSCIVRGYGVADEDTISNYLQQSYNQASEERVHVWNYGTGGATGYQGMINDLKYMLDCRYEYGDIVVFVAYHTALEGLIKKQQKKNYMELSSSFSDGKVSEWWFLNSTVHLNHVGNRIIADALYERLSQESLADIYTDDIQKTVGKLSGDKPEDKGFRKENSLKEAAAGKQKEALSDRYNDNIELKRYIEYLQKVKAEAHVPEGVQAGAIVMNCNPFTLGHRYLVEEALKSVEHLYLFVVEENKSFFEFEDRLAMVKEGTKDLENITVLPSGKFIISALTFPEYFQKEENQEIRIDVTEDIAIFGTYIAPALDISVRFAGTEPLDAVTNQYNKAMNEMLERYNIKFRCIERCSLDGEYINATKVRSFLKEGNADEVKKYVPDSTWNILQKYINTDGKM